MIHILQAAATPMILIRNSAGSFLGQREELSAELQNK